MQVPPRGVKASLSWRMAEEAPSQVSSLLRGQQWTRPFWSARNLFLSGDIFWHLLMFSPVLLLYYFVCVCPDVLQHLQSFQKWDLAGFIHKGCSFFAFQSHFLKLGSANTCSQAVFKQHSKWRTELHKHCPHRCPALLLSPGTAAHLEPNTDVWRTATPADLRKREQK